MDNEIEKNADIKLTQFSRGAGCGCKIAPNVLEEILKSNFTLPHDKNLLVGNSSKDDAAVYDIGNGKVQFHQHYLTLPVLAEFTFGKKVQPFVNAGIYLGVLLNSKTVFRYGDNKTSDNITNDKQRIDVGVMASAGIKVPVKKSCSFVFEVRNNIGLLNVYKNNFPGSERYKTRNYSTSFNVGFSYRFSKNEADSK